MGEVRMVDVGGKPEVFRSARAVGKIRLGAESVERLRSGRVEKGDVFSVARTAAILAVKRTPEIVPLCHPIPITHVSVDLRVEEDGVVAEVEVSAVAKTGVEMEALTGVAVALLNVWDMLKKYEKDEAGQYPHTEIEEIRVLEKVKLGAGGEARDQDMS